MSYRKDAFTLIGIVNALSTVALEAGFTTRNFQKPCSRLSRVSHDQQLSLLPSKYRQAATNNVLVF